MPYIATVAILDAAKLRDIRHAVRDKIRDAGVDAKSGHVGEGVAAAFGFRSHAALLAGLAAAGGTLPGRDFLTDALASRLMALAAVPEGARAMALAGAVDRAVRSLDKKGVLDSHGRHVLPPIDWESEGRMISASKSGYYRNHPNNLIVFNARVMTEADGAIWHGDLDVTRDLPQLQAKSIQLGTPLHIIREGAYWNGGNGEPPLSVAIAVVIPEGLLDPTSPVPSVFAPVG